MTSLINVTYKVEYQSKDGTQRFTHLVPTMREALKVSREARERGFKPKRERIETTTNYVVARKVF